MNVGRLFSCIRLPLSPPTRTVLLQSRVFASMSQKPSQACCNTPAVISDGYKEKGEFSTIDGLKTYTTGPKSSSGILVIYDIFGFFPQTLQGADILSGLHHDEKETQRKFKIFMPDCFEGDYADISWFPPDNKEKGEKLGNFFKTTADAPKNIEKLNSFMKEVKQKNPDIKQWGVLGYCWGGKIANLLSQEGTVFKAAAACHPAMVDAADAPKVTIPIMLIPSKDESKDDVKKYEENLKVKYKTEWFDDQIHGFMAARSDLKDDKVLKAYEQSYSMLSDWYSENLGGPYSKL